jgi:hypothetical protein
MNAECDQASRVALEGGKANGFGLSVTAVPLFLYLGCWWFFDLNRVSDGEKLLKSTAYWIGLPLINCFVLLMTLGVAEVLSGRRGYLKRFMAGILAGSSHFLVVVLWFLVPKGLMLIALLIGALTGLATMTVLEIQMFLCGFRGSSVAANRLPALLRTKAFYLCLLSSGVAAAFIGIFLGFMLYGISDHLNFSLLDPTTEYLTWLSLNAVFFALLLERLLRFAPVSLRRFGRLPLMTLCGAGFGYTGAIAIGSLVDSPDFLSLAGGVVFLAFATLFIWREEA